MFSDSALEILKPGSEFGFVGRHLTTHVIYLADQRTREVQGRYALNPLPTFGPLVTQLPIPSPQREAVIGSTV